MPENKQKFSRIFGSSFAFWFAQKFENSHSTHFILCPSAECSDDLFQELSYLLPPENLAYFPSYDSFVFQEVMPPMELVARRIDSFLKLQKQKPLVIISEVSSLAEKIPIFESLASFSLDVGKKYNRVSLIQKLLEWGYSRMDIVEEKGEFTQRGEVLDIFSIQQQEAHRLNFFDDELESIKSLDTETQLSKKVLQTLTLFPAREIIPSKKNIAQAIDCLRLNRQKLIASDYQETLANLEEGNFFLARKYFSCFCSQFIPYTKLLPQNTQFLFWKKEQLDFALQSFFVEGQEEHQNIASYEQIPEFHNFYYNEEEVLNALKNFPQLEIFENLESSTTNCDFYDLSSLFFNVQANWKQKLELIKNKTQDGCKVIFCVNQKQRLKHLADILEDLGFGEVVITENILDFVEKNKSQKQLFQFSNLNTEVLYFPLQKSFYKGIFQQITKKSIPSYCFISEKDLWSKRTTFQKTKKLNDFKTKISSLKIGDFVVHIDHGIGKYLGLQNIESGGQKEDFLLIEYANNAKLYVRVDEINYKIQKYDVSTVRQPLLSTLGSKEWKLKKKKVEKGVQEIAEGLLRIYAERKIKTRTPFCPSVKEIDVFANDFSFVETDDQLQAIEDIFQDLSNEKPMDRLICGDAGFGKTEVAMRAAFQVAITGFQVLVLAPTTVLVNQHFYTFRERFKNFPVRIEFISSFLTAKQNEATAIAFRQRKIEILIGTHTLFYKNFTGDAIGLLIIDEEHRFGVKQKEKLKEFRATIDVLSMSATPIPRTLNLSLLGIRDISLITTPPQDRKQSKTKVLYYKDNIIQEVVKREVNRGGQVFILYNQVASIESFLSHLQSIIPNYKIGLAHGQMPKKNLGKIMFEFANNHFPVLLCTTIIESGLDIPNANSLIVYNATIFGLSQLYQIRGRVGRSNKQAYIYFLLKAEKKITDKAKQRLNILQETQSREGYKVASQDLELRGVGNLVGVEQSGHLQTVGYNLFIAMLEQTIGLIGQKKNTLARNSIRIFSYIKGYIPEKFIPSMNMRLYIYQTMNQCYDEQRIIDFQEELSDRFGVIPPEVNNLFEIIRLKNFAAENYLLEIDFLPDNIKIKPSENFPMQTKNMLQLSKDSAIKFLPNNSILLQKNLIDLQAANTEIRKILDILTK